MAAEGLYLIVHLEADALPVKIVVLVNILLVHHHMQLDLAGELGVQALEELQKFLMAMSRVTLSDDFALSGATGSDLNIK